MAIRKEYRTTYIGNNPVQDPDPITQPGLMPDLDDESYNGAGDGDEIRSTHIEKLRDKLQAVCKLVGDSLSNPAGSLAEILDRDHTNGDAKQLRFGKRTSAPSTVSEKAYLYALDDGGVAKLYVKWDDGTAFLIGDISPFGVTNTVAGANGITNTGDNVDAVLEPTYGSASTTICEGNDARLSDSRTCNNTFDDAATARTNLDVYNKNEVDAKVVGLLDYKGAYDATTNIPDLDTSPSGILKGDTYTVSVAGNFFTEPVSPGDMLIAEQDNPTTLDHWSRVNQNWSFGASAGTACEGNDSRLSDSRTCNNTFDDAATARTNLDVYSKSEVDTRVEGHEQVYDGSASGSIDIHVDYVVYGSGTLDTPSGYHLLVFRDGIKMTHAITPSASNEYWYNSTTNEIRVVGDGSSHRWEIWYKTSETTPHVASGSTLGTATFGTDTFDG